MKIIFLLCIVGVLFSCKRECDCTDLAAQYSYSEQIDLPKQNEELSPSGFSLDISIDKNNILTLDSEEKTIEEIDSVIVMLLEKNEEPLIKVFADAKSDFSVFNDVLNLSKTHSLKLVIAQD